MDYKLLKDSVSNLLIRNSIQITTHCGPLSYIAHAFPSCAANHQSMCQRLCILSGREADCKYINKILSIYLVFCLICLGQINLMAIKICFVKVPKTSGGRLICTGAACSKKERQNKSKFPVMGGKAVLFYPALSPFLRL